VHREEAEAKEEKEGGRRRSVGMSGSAPIPAPIEHPLPNGIFGAKYPKPYL